MGSTISSSFSQIRYLVKASTSSPVKSWPILHNHSISLLAVSEEDDSGLAIMYIKFYTNNINDVYNKHLVTQS